MNFSTYKKLLLSGLVVSLLNPTACAQKSSINKITTCHIIPNAEIISDKNVHPSNVRPDIKELTISNYGHQIHKGKNIVISIRIFEDNGLGVDTQKFTKITLELQKLQTLKTENEYLILKSFYLHGSSGFVSQGDYWTSFNDINSIKMFKSFSEKRLEINSSIRTKHQFDKVTKLVNLNISCPLQELDVSKLNEWNGKAGTSWKSFVPAKQSKKGDGQ